mgnify:CR=1 FL=1
MGSGNKDGKRWQGCKVWTRGSGGSCPLPTACRAAARVPTPAPPLCAVPCTQVLCDGLEDDLKLKLTQQRLAAEAAAAAEGEPATPCSTLHPCNFRCGLHGRRTRRSSHLSRTQRRMCCLSPPQTMLHPLPPITITTAPCPSRRHHPQATRPTRSSSAPRPRCWCAAAAR